jgi:hypothetical protein
MKRKPKLTKRERKAAAPTQQQHQHAHIHCIACGVHLDPGEFAASPPTATYVRCQHGSTFSSCVGCVPMTRQLLAEHDRTGQPVKQAAAWH